MIQLRLWMQDAYCSKKKNDFWYPPLDSDNPESYYAIGREICRRCSVWTNCLDAGLEEKWGMWGGLTPQERTTLTSNNPKQSTYYPHGSWIRYRQGCRCTDCTNAHEQPVDSISMSIVPLWEDDIEDLEMLRFQLLSPPSDVT